MRQARCDGCRKETWVNISDGRGKTAKRPEVLPGEYCADCFEKFDLGGPKRRNIGQPAASDETGPSWDDVVRALEEDR